MSALTEVESIRKRDNLLWLFVIVLMVVNVGVLTYTTVYDGGGLNDSQLETEVEQLRFRLNQAQQDLEALKDEIRITNITSDVSTHELTILFNRTRNSVVLITTDRGTGSGWVYDTDGHIITNNHVIEDATQIQVTFQSGSIYPATLIGRDPYSDMAVIKINPSMEQLTPLEIAVSSQLLTGETVIAIGNPFGLANTMTAGIISATGRQMLTSNNYAIVDVIQTDAAINPGNSGGPLLNTEGEVVGMNTAIISGSNDFSGIGFAIPSDTITREINTIIEEGSYHHPWLGVSGHDLAPQLAESMGLKNTTRGTLIIETVPDGPADQAGLLESTEQVTINGFTYRIGGDIIIGLDSEIVDSFYELQVYLTRNTVPGDTVIMKVIRDGNIMDISLTLGVRPPLN